VRATGQGAEKERKTFPVPHAGNGSKNSKWWFSSLSFIVESWGIHVVKDNRSRWLR
jgi:hypothetical protein